ncbi:hypothetical protein Hanom_Chr06g00525241 [Helianthus anomalus]
MPSKRYKGDKAQYKEWTVGELKEELKIIEKMNEEKVTHTPPVWVNYKKNMPDKVLKLKRMKEELITPDFGARNQVTRWKEERVFASYKKLEELRKKNPDIPQKPVYPETVVAPKQTLQIKSSVSTAAPTVVVFHQRKKQKQMDAGKRTTRAHHERSS